VTCDYNGNIIALHFFENALQGIFPDNIANLAYLLHLNIFNDGREHEYEDNMFKNTVHVWHQEIHRIASLENINMVNLEMNGRLDDSFNDLINL
jgi:hypothetical protein